MSQELIERLKLEAQIHAQEARTANATIAEIYQLCSGSKGEPGNWHGAEPVRALVAERDALAATLRQPAAPVGVPDGVMERLIRLQVGGCSCSTKTPELKHHREDCRYRLAAEVMELLAAAPSAPQGTQQGGRVMVIGEHFVVGEVWESPRGTLYKVVERDGWNVTLRAGVNGSGRKVRRGWSDVIGWFLPPEHNTKPPERK